jgi:hypothetical protein
MVFKIWNLIFGYSMEHYCRLLSFITDIGALNISLSKICGTGKFSINPADF